MINRILEYIFQNVQVFISGVFSCLSLIISCRSYFKNNSKNINEKNYRIKIIQASAACGIISIIMIVAYQLFVTKANTTKSEIGILLDMQSITLAITGISISLISIISTVLSSKREEKYDKIEKSIKDNISILEKEKKELTESLGELKIMQKNLKDNANRLTGLMLTDSMFLDKRKERLLFDLASKSESFFEKYFYIRVLYENYYGNASEETKTRWYKSIITQGESIIQNWEKQDLSGDFSKTQKYMTLIMISDAYFFLAESSIINIDNRDDSTILNYFDKAETYYNLADDLYADEDGYISNGKGLFAFWKYKYYLNKGEKRVELLDTSIDFYDQAIQIYPLKPQYFNNKGVSLLQKAKLVKDNSQLLDDAGKCFREALRLNSRAAKASINLADISITKIRKLMNAEDEIIILQKLNQSTQYYEEFIKNFDIAKMNLNNSIAIEPHFVNSYYKLAQLYSYYLLYLNKTNKLDNATKHEIMKKIEQLFGDCGEINPNAESTYYIKRMYFDVINDFDNAEKINKKIESFNAKNSQQWNTAYCEYLKLQEEQTDEK